MTIVVHREEEIVRPVLTLLILVALAIVSVAAFRQMFKDRPALQLSPCDVPGIQGKMKCGELEVFEDRATSKGRKIKIKVLVVPATGNSPLPKRSTPSMSNASCVTPCRKLPGDVSYTERANHSTI